MIASKLLSSTGALRKPPAFVSSSVARYATLTNTVTAPAGIQNGDLLVAVGFNLFSGSTVSVPAGFNLVYLENSTGNTMFIAVKSAASESGDYSFTWSATNSNAVSILVYRDATRVNTVGAISRATSNTVTASSINPSYSGRLCAVFANEDDNVVVGSFPTDMTNRVSYIGSTGVRPGAFLIYDKYQAASSSGNKTLTFSVSNGPITAGLLFQITNEPYLAPEFVSYASTQSTVVGQTLTVSKPSGTISGDLMLAVMSAGGTGSGSWTGDTGWTEIADEGSLPNLRLAYKMAGESEPSIYTFTCAEPNNLTTGCILTYRYASYDTVGVFVTNSDPLNLASITPSKSQSALIACGTVNEISLTLVAPTSMTPRVTDSDTRTTSYRVFDQIVQSGYIGARYIGLGSGSASAGILVSIKPSRSF